MFLVFLLETPRVSARITGPPLGPYRGGLGSCFVSHNSIKAKVQRKVKEKRQRRASAVALKWVLGID